MKDKPQSQEKPSTPPKCKSSTKCKGEVLKSQGDTKRAGVATEDYFKYIPY